MDTTIDCYFAGSSWRGEKASCRFFTFSSSARIARYCCPAKEPIWLKMIVANTKAAAKPPPGSPLTRTPQPTSKIPTQIQFAIAMPRKMRGLKGISFIVLPLPQGFSRAGGALRLRICFRPLEPGRGLRVAGHAPVAARRQADGADFRTVRQHGTLELIVEKALDENAQPAANFLRRVFSVEVGVLGQKQNFFRRSAIAQEVKQTEIVTLVRADGAFCVLNC